MTHIEICEKDFSLGNIVAYLKADEVGAMVFFVGTVRQSAESQLVEMEIEAYDTMCVSALEEICARMYERFSIHDIFIHHRKGTLSVQDSIVVIGVSAPHRQEAYEANQAILEEIKTRVPLWKKEIFADSEVWVEGEKPDSLKEDV
jgi:molybdopterin synthase catalytic subunit